MVLGGLARDSPQSTHCTGLASICSVRSAPSASERPSDRDRSSASPLQLPFSPLLLDSSASGLLSNYPGQTCRNQGIKVGHALKNPGEICKKSLCGTWWLCCLPLKSSYTGCLAAPFWHDLPWVMVFWAGTKPPWCQESFGLMSVHETRPVLGETARFFFDFQGSM